MTMNKRDFLLALLASRGITANSLANQLRAKQLQPVMSRMVSSPDTYEPRYSSLEPIARFFGVPTAAFFEDDLAAKVAAELGLTGKGASVATEPATSYANTTQLPTPQQSVTNAIVRIGRALAPYDESARRAAASLLTDLAMNPEGAPLVASRIDALLSAGTGGNENPQKSINSRGGQG